MQGDGHGWSLHSLSEFGKGQRLYLQDHASLLRNSNDIYAQASNRAEATGHRQQQREVTCEEHL